MTREEIIRHVRDYVRDEKAQYAVLIDSPWGSGKTYLYDHHLVDAVSTAIMDGEPKENIYISLYGIATIDALAKQLMTNFMLHLKWKRGNSSKEVFHRWPLQFHDLAGRMQWRQGLAYQNTSS